MGGVGDAPLKVKSHPPAADGFFLFRSGDFTRLDSSHVAVIGSSNIRHQEVEAQYVREGHGKDHRITEVEHTSGGDGRSNDDKHTEHGFIGQVGQFALSKQISPGFQSVVGPGDHGGQGK